MATTNKLDIFEVDNCNSLFINEVNRTSANATSNRNFYSRYYIFTEINDDNDIPAESRYNLYSLYDEGINGLRGDDSWKITISEEVKSHTQILLPGNSTYITNTFYVVNDEIDYDKINSLLPEIDAENESVTSADISAILWDWVNEYADLSINMNPENADESNYILTQALRKNDDIRKMTESILQKVFRNFVQLIRVKHDYRLYGKGSTVFGGTSTVFNSNDNIGKWSSLDGDCWTTYNGHYIVGKSAYNENIASISSTIQNVSAKGISPYTSFGLAAHSHTVTSSTGNIPSGCEVAESIITSIPTPSNPGHKPKWEGAGLFTDSTIKTLWNSWNPSPQNGRGQKVTSNGAWAWTMWQKYFGLSYGAGCGFPYNIEPTTEAANFEADGWWEYSWDSNGCKLTTTTTDPYCFLTTHETTLPTYSSYVWKWSGSDKTDIKNPSKYIHS